MADDGHTDKTNHLMFPFVSNIDRCLGYVWSGVCVISQGQYVVPVTTAVGPVCMVRLEKLPQKVTAAEDNHSFFTTLPTKSTKKEEK